MTDDTANAGDAVAGLDVPSAEIDTLRLEIDALRLSRRRLVAAEDTDRRAFEGELHDGVQQQLVALAVDLRRLAGLLDADPTAAHALVDEMTANVTTALADATALAGRIHPPLLAVRGLPSALRSAAEPLGITLDVDIPTGGAYRSEITTALYWTCVEMLSFASRGSHATVIVMETDGQVRFDIGLDRRPPEEQLIRLRDRIEGLDGGLTVDDGPDGGSLVHGWVAASR